MRISSPDVYKLPIAGMRACLTSIEHAIDADGGIAAEAHDAICRVYEALLSVQNHVVNRYPLKKD